MGGMEAHCRMLCDGLRARGHDVTLFAAGGSDDAQLVPICHAPYEDVLPWVTWRGTEELAQYQRAAFEAGWEIIRAGGFDLVHNNSLFPDLIDWAARDRVACVTSHHVPPFEAIRAATERHIGTPWIRFTLPSHAQRANWAANHRDRLHVVHNGISTTRWTPGAQRAGYFVWSGRITPNKGTHHAVQAARMAGAALRLFGPVEDADYFAAEIAPWLTDDIAYLGHCPAAQLAREVGAALGVVVTPLWDEPFGLVAAEALASGTPVCAFDSGALAEVVGRCGFIVPTGDTEALANAMRNVWRINRDDCRMRAEQMFSGPAMITGYERLYREAIGAAASSAQVVVSA
jgi:glycosyltransferase involved in cell wall biosynthesis